MEDNEKEQKDTTPQWFKKWRNNDFRHLELKVGLNTKLSITIIAAIIAFAIAIIAAKVIS